MQYMTASNMGNINCYFILVNTQGIIQSYKRLQVPHKLGLWYLSLELLNYCYVSCTVLQLMVKERLTEEFNVVP